MKIVFGIMSALQPAATVASLCDALGTGHPILIHHDWSQQPGFSIERPNVSFVNNPQRTGWGNWGFTQGILRLVAQALEDEPFDYFQLLSPTCMPIQPVEAFASYLDRTRADFYVDSVRLDEDPYTLLSHGWRAFAPENTWRHRMLRRSRRWIFGGDGAVVNRAGLSFPTQSLLRARGIAGLKARAGLAITNLARDRVGFRHVFSEAYPCHVGSTWFTASRRGCEHLMEEARSTHRVQYFSRLHMGDEMFFPTVFQNSGMRCAPAPHYIARFVDARPLWLGVDDLREVLQSGRFFARKFPEDPDCDVRKALLSSLAFQRSNDTKLVAG